MEFKVIEKNGYQAHPGKIHTSSMRAVRLRSERRASAFEFRAPFCLLRSARHTALEVRNAVGCHICRRCCQIFSESATFVGRQLQSVLGGFVKMSEIK